MPKRTDNPKANTLKVRAWRAANPAKRKALQNKYQTDPELRDKMWRYGRELAARRREKQLADLGGKCACCGESEKAFLQIDHINDDGALDRRNGHRRSFTYASPVQILCANCNYAKHRGGCPHSKRENVA